MDKPTKQRLRITNVAADGFAFAINEETATTVFLSRQLCAASDVSRDDVGAYIDCMVSDGAKGPQAVTLDFVEEVEEATIETLQKQIEELTSRVAELEKRV